MNFGTISPQPQPYPPTNKLMLATFTHTHIYKGDEMGLATIDFILCICFLFAFRSYLFSLKTHTKRSKKNRRTRGKQHILFEGESKQQEESFFYIWMKKSHKYRAITNIV
jgi:hypothetical protein